MGTSVGTSPRNDSSQPPVSDWLVDSRGGTRTRDPGIMRVSESTLGDNSPFTRSYTDSAQDAPTFTRFGSARGTTKNTAAVGGEVCSRVLGKLPSCMGADWQHRAAGVVSGWEETPSQERPNKSFPGGRRGAKPPALGVSEPHAAASERAACGCCRPSLDTQGTSCTRRPPIHVGGAWAREFRELVADELKEHWPERARAMRQCGLSAVQLNCKCCSASTLVPFRCGARTCPTCARIGAAAVADRTAARVAIHDLQMESEPWDGPGNAQKRSWRMLTLTTRAEADVDARFNRHALRTQVRRVRAVFSQFWRSTDWGRQVRDGGARRKRSRRDTSYVFAQEVSPSGMVHVHALVFGEYIPQLVLEAAWGQCVRGRARVDVRTVAGPRGVASALREVLKYATKGEKGVRVQPERAAAVELAFRNVHRLGLGGAVRRVRVSESDGATDDVTPADLVDDGALSCSTCGVVGEWTWVGIVSERLVADVGGFGPIHGPPNVRPIWSG